MAESSDYLTLDVYDQPPGGSRHWSKSVNAALQQGIPGLRSVTVNHSNHLTHSLDPRTLIRPGRALIAAWDSPESALAAFRGPLAWAVRRPAATASTVRWCGCVAKGRRMTGTGGTRRPREVHPYRPTSPWWSSCTASSGHPTSSGSSRTTSTLHPGRRFIPATAAASTSHRGFRSSTLPSAYGAQRNWRETTRTHPVDTRTPWSMPARPTPTAPASTFRCDRWRVPVRWDWIRRRSLIFRRRFRA